MTCAEKSPAHCHRSLLADLLSLRGWEVRHLGEDGETAHQLRNEARLEEGGLAYPPVQGSLF